MILSAVLATGILLTSCGREESSVNMDTQPKKEETPKTPEQPKNPTDERPKDHYIGLRGYAKDWKEGVDALNQIDIADLHNNLSNIKNKIKELSVFAASEPEGTKFYTLKDADLQDLTLEDIEYNGENIYFKTVYKGVKSNFRSSLKFNAVEFYERKITVNQPFVSTQYMRGIYEHGFEGSVFSYDENRYQIELVRNGAYKDDYNNTLRYTITVTDKNIKDKRKQETIITKEVNGFKTLKQLADDLKITYKLSWLEKVKEKVAKKPNQDNFIQDLEGLFSNKWKEDFNITLSNGKSLIYYNGEDILIGGAGHLDIYLARPVFVLKSATLQGNYLHMTIQFQQANEVVINKEYTIVINNVKS